jgi:hypothetical protein
MGLEPELFWFVYLGFMNDVDELIGIKGVT